MLNPPPPESSLFPDPDNRPVHTAEQTHISVRTAAYIIASGVLAAGITYYFGFKKPAAPTEPVVVQADAAPVKERPEQPGGIDIPFQDVTIYEKISKNGAEPTRKIERFLPEENSPIESKTVVEPVPTAAPTEKVERAEAAPPVVEKKPEAKPVVETAPTVLKKPETKEAKKSEAAKEAPKKTEAAKPQEKTIESIIAEQAQQPAAAKGGFRIQLGAFPEEQIAKTELARLQRKYNSALGGVKLVLLRADLGSRGVFFRIQSPGLSEKQAEKICADIKAAKGGCLIARP
jgi:hypothetical protein